MTDTAIAPTSIASDTATAKIHVEQPFLFEGPEYPIVHEVLNFDSETALCGVDVSKAVWADGGYCCAACHLVEMEMFGG